MLKSDLPKTRYQTTTDDDVPRLGTSSFCVVFKKRHSDADDAGGICIYRFWISYKTDNRVNATAHAFSACSGMADDIEGAFYDALPYSRSMDVFRKYRASIMGGRDLVKSVVFPPICGNGSVEQCSRLVDYGQAYSIRSAISMTEGARNEFNSMVDSLVSSMMDAIPRLESMKF